MTPEQFEDRLRLALEKYQGRVITPALKREVEDALIAEFCDIRDDISAGAVRLA